MFQGGNEVETMGAIIFGMEGSTPYRHERVASGLDKYATANGIDIDHAFFSRHVEIDPRHGQSILMTIRDWLSDPVKVNLLSQGAIRSFDARKIFLDQVLEQAKR
jgi:pyrroloquinoline quinone (PQQ) biosynthesis protein C